MTAQRKKLIVAGFIGVALALDLIASVLSSDGRHSAEARTLFGVATGVIFAGVVFILMYRRPS
jgi:ABC-type Fe3+-siderophore transport system permease subunit